jgi:K+ transporter
VYGDAAITPAISVMSALEGLNIAAPLARAGAARSSQRRVAAKLVETILNPHQTNVVELAARR